jgi:hypothetical protein
MPVHSTLFKVSEGNNLTVHMTANFSQLLKGIDMKNVYKVNPITDLHDATLLDNNTSATCFLMSSSKRWVGYIALALPVGFLLFISHSCTKTDT